MGRGFFKGVAIVKVLVLPETASQTPHPFSCLKTALMKFTASFPNKGMKEEGPVEKGIFRSRRE